MNLTNCTFKSQIKMQTQTDRNEGKNTNTSYMLLTVINN